MEEINMNECYIPTREEILQNLGRTEGDVMEDDGGEYVLAEIEEKGGRLVTYKVRL